MKEKEKKKRIYLGSKNLFHIGLRVCEISRETVAVNGGQVLRAQLVAHPSTTEEPPKHIW